MRPGESLEGSSRSARGTCVSANRSMKRDPASGDYGGMTVWRGFLWSLVLCCLSTPSQGFIYTCGGTMKGRNGSIESPGFPYGYPNGANCTWVIVGEHGSRIQLVFLSFAIEEEYDFLSLYDGHPHPANFRTRLTGFQVPTPVTSTGNVFSLRLTSDFAVSAHGFKLNYEELQSSSCGNPGVPPKAVLSGGGKFAVGDSVHYSCVPGYVLDGHATLTCITNAGNTAVWDFPAPICRDFQTEEKYDYLEVEGSEPPTIWLSGSNIPSPIVSNKNWLRLHFVTDGNHRYRGFSAHYQVKRSVDFKSRGVKLFPGKDSSNKFSILNEGGVRQASNSCPDPGEPENGKRHGSDFSIGSEVHFTCGEDYVLQGSKTISCQRVAEVFAAWSDHRPVCKVYRHRTGERDKDAHRGEREREREVRGPLSPAAPPLLLTLQWMTFVRLFITTHILVQWLEDVVW
ncbi:hypothetical protein WMY93_019861 [Mugilogobius chulae]|uniref:CUB and Sushi multiple domains 3 n=1 Tax=Mugilogobius chulae TaxID=88201 RepID=A0AAW0NGL0_9GOBI